MRKGHRVARSGLAKTIFAVLRPKQAKAIAINANALQLEHRSGFSQISLGDLKSAEIKTGWLWSRVRIRHNDEEAIVSGLPSSDTQAFVQALESARVQWWWRTLATPIETLRAIYDKLAQLADPPTYVRHTAFAELKTQADTVAGQFSTFWPSTLSEEPEIRMLKAIQDFLKNPERVRKKANAVFVANELERSKGLFDRIEKRPLTEEQRKSVVIDEEPKPGRGCCRQRQNLSDCSQGRLAAGSRSYRRPSELLLLAFARDARKEMEERICNRLGDRLG